jgi:hypothetical protein
MKKLLSALVLVTLTNSVQSQTIGGDDNNEDYWIIKDGKTIVSLNNSGQDYSPNMSIEKEDLNTKKNVFKVSLNIPDKKNDEIMFFPVDKISTMLIDNDIQIIYDVYDKKANLKKCFLKTLGVKGSPLSEAKLLSETECKTKFSIGNTNYRVIYSPDKSKFALLLDNYSKGVVIEPSITIFDSKKLTTLSTKKLKSMYNGNKAQIDPYNNFKIDNTGNITLIFNTHNKETNMVIKSYQGDIPFSENDIKNIKEAGGGVASSDNTSGEVNKYEPGRFYNTLQDYVNNKPLEDYKIKSGSYMWGTIGGESFKLIDKNGNIEKEKLSKFPSSLFTYRGEYATSFDLYRAFENEAYKIVTVGNIWLYTHRQATGNGGEKDVLYYSEGGISGEINKFKENDLEGWLEKAGLLEDYKKDNPKREFKDDKSDFYTKEVSRYIKYIDILNKKK